MTDAATSVLAQMHGVFDYVRKHQFSGAVIGPAGIGKSHCATAYARANALTHMITATDALGAKPNFLWRVVSDALGIMAGESAAETQDILFQHDFRQNVLIVDEAQQVPPVQLREILQLHDRCGLSVVFCGNMEVLQQSRGRQRGWEQVESRLSVIHHLEGIDDRDADALSALHSVRGEDALAIMRAIGERFHARGIAHVLEATRRTIGEGPPIDAAAIRSTLTFLPKYRAAIKPKRITGQAA